MRVHLFSAVAGLAMVLGSVATSPAQETRPVRGMGLRPVPAEAELVDVRRGLRHKYGADYADLTPAGKRRLANLLAREAGNAAGDAALYVTLNEARELAIGAGEVELALQLAAELGRRFDLDAEALRMATLQGCEKAKLSPQQAGVLARSARAVVEARLAADDFDGALRAARLADEAARRAGESSLQTELALLLAFCQDVLKRVPDYRAAMTKLAAEPEDPAANQRAGEFLAVVKQEWGRALLMLSRGTDGMMKQAAAAELSAGRGSELLAAADAWAAWAEKRHGPGRLIAQRHAYELYARSVEGCTGTDLDRCLERAATLLSGLPAGTEMADLRAARVQLGEPRWDWWQSLRVGALDVRSDAASLKSSQVLLAWSPKTDAGGELPEPPDEPANLPIGKKRLTYILRTLVIDDRGERVILEKTGNVTWRSLGKPLALTGPTNAELKRTNAGKVIPAGAHLVLFLDGVKVCERVWKLPAKRAWWLEESLVVRK